MRIAAAVAASLIIVIVLVDAFNTIILARRTHNSFRITRAVYVLTWRPFACIARNIESSRRREGFLGVYGPLSLVLIFALWVAALILAFGLLQWGTGFQSRDMAPTVVNDIFLSATTLFTLQTGNPQTALSRFITAIEGGLGISLLGLVVSFLPVFYEAFSRRELQIFLLDARAGSPPSAIELLRIHVSNPDRIERYMERWEKWAAEVLENQLSFPMMAWFRSHHANQSWLTALTAIMDCSTVVSLCAEGDLKTQAEFTFAMGRHALQDVAAILHVEPASPPKERLAQSDFAELHSTLEKSSAPLQAEKLSETDLFRLRSMYEPYAHALSAYLLMALPEWHSSGATREDWKTPVKQDGQAVFAVSDPFSKDSGPRLEDPD